MDEKGNQVGEQHPGGKLAQTGDEALSSAKESRSAATLSFGKVMAGVCALSAVILLACVAFLLGNENQVSRFEASLGVSPSHSFVKANLPLILATTIGSVLLFGFAARYWYGGRRLAALFAMLIPPMGFGLVINGPAGPEFIKAWSQVAGGRKSPYWIAEDQDPNFVNDLLNGHTRVHDAARAGNVAWLNYLVSCGGDVNTEGRSTGGETPMCVASTAEMVDCLVEHGALIDDHNSKGHTPLIALCYRNHADAVKRLVEWGADVNKQDTVSDMNSLGWLCAGFGRDVFFEGSSNLTRQRLELIQYLVEHGVDIDDQDHRGRTPLHLCILNHNAAAALVLLDLQADPYRPDHSGRQPAELAEARRMPEVVRAIAAQW